MTRWLTGSDYRLGQTIAALFAAQRGSDLPAGAILAQLQDLLGSDTALLVPLRDLLQRPAYRQLQDQGAAGDSPSQLLAGRDALLQDLALTYQPAVLARLAAVIDGSLALPPGPAPSVTASASVSPDAGAAADPRRGSPGWSGAWSQPAQVPPWQGGMPPSTPHSQPSSGQGPSQQVPYGPPAPATPQSPPPPAQAASGPSTITALLIALVSLLSGALLLALGWLLFSGRPQVVTSAAPVAPATPAASASAAATPVASASPPPTPKDQTPDPKPDAPAGGWGSASDYKFGQLPGGAYPNSCAFSVTDANGRTTTDKSQIEYWACRDVGGNPETGYRVVWADGKETNYTFQSGGDGQVVGTNGSTYPMRWRNDTHQGDPIVVINHQDGAITWIPGQIN